MLPGGMDGYSSFMLNLEFVSYTSSAFDEGRVGLPYCEDGGAGTH